MTSLLTITTVSTKIKSVALCLHVSSVKCWGQPLENVNESKVKLENFEMLPKTNNKTFLLTKIA